MFDKDYNRILSVIKKWIYQRKTYIIEPSDVLAEGFLKFTEAKIEYSFETFISFCYKAFFSESEQFERKNKNGVTAKKQKWNGSEERCCNVCKNVFPIEMFYTIRLPKKNKEFKMRSCKKCHIRKRNLYKKKRRLNLPDREVINIVLSRKANRWSKEFILNRPRLIEIERNIILRKRKNRLKKIKGNMAA